MVFLKAPPNCNLEGLIFLKSKLSHLSANFFVYVDCYIYIYKLLNYSS